MDSGGGRRPRPCRCTSWRDPSSAARARTIAPGPTDPGVVAAGDARSAADAAGEPGSGTRRVHAPTDRRRPNPVTRRGRLLLEIGLFLGPPEGGPYDRE